MRAHLEQVIKTKKKLGLDWSAEHAQLNDIPPIPEALKYIWEWYREIWTPERLTYSELMEWSRAVRVNLLPRETRVLMSINRAHVGIVNG
jgi:hypothetical protein